MHIRRNGPSKTLHLPTGDAEVLKSPLWSHVAGVADRPHNDTAEAWQPYSDTYAAGGMPSGAEIPSG
jgi:hypothetical protein